MTHTTYPMGSEVKYRDVRNVLSVDAVAVAVGTVNGKPIELPDGQMMVPVWTSRDNGREATTIWVNSANIVATGQ